MSGSKLQRMGRAYSFKFTLLAAVILCCAVIKSGAQTEDRSLTAESGVVLVDLFRPVYPPLALQARITGDVELRIEVRQDGTVESVTAVSGHPIFKEAALDSARKSKFECVACSGAVTLYKLAYRFDLGPTIYCSTKPARPIDSREEKTYPQILQSQNRITLVDAPVDTCDLPPELPWKVRSAKCLYLWKCGRSDARGSH
jgi:TonB family protein